MKLTYKITKKYDSLDFKTFSPKQVFLMKNIKYRYQYFVKFIYNFDRKIKGAEFIMTDSMNNILNVETITDAKVINSYFQIEKLEDQTLTAFGSKIYVIEKNSVGIDFELPL